MFLSLLLLKNALVPVETLVLTELFVVKILYVFLNALMLVEVGKPPELYVMEDVNPLEELYVVRILYVFLNALPRSRCYRSSTSLRMSTCWRSSTWCAVAQQCAPGLDGAEP